MNRWATAGRSQHRRRSGGFSLLELIIVITVIGILAAIAVPNLIQVPRRADEAVLRTNLRTIRQVIDQHNADQGFFPPALETLVEEGYLRNVPLDPITEASEWGLVYEEGVADEEYAETDLPDDWEPGLIDVYSLSGDVSLDGEPYSDW